MSPLLTVVRDITMPLYTERQLCALVRRGASSNGREHPREKMITCNENSHVDTQSYYIHDENINKQLSQLHRDLRNGVPGSQQEIDRYLFAAGPMLSIPIPQEELILPLQLIVRFENLPNIHKYIEQILTLKETETTPIAFHMHIAQGPAYQPSLRFSI